MSYVDFLNSAGAVRSAFSLPHRSSLLSTSNPNHNLWNNNGTWWINFTVLSRKHPRAERVRFSLRTRDLDLARLRRDEILSVFS